MTQTIARGPCPLEQSIAFRKPATVSKMRGPPSGGAGPYALIPETLGQVNGVFGGRESLRSTHC